MSTIFRRIEEFFRLKPPERSTMSKMTGNGRMKRMKETEETKRMAEMDKMTKMEQMTELEQMMEMDQMTGMEPVAKMEKEQMEQRSGDMTSMSGEKRADQMRTDK